MKQWTSDRWIATGSIIVSVLYMLAAWKLPRFTMAAVVDAHVFPLFIGVCQLLLSLWLWMISSSDKKQDSPWQGLELKGGAFLLLLAAMYIEALEMLGFIITTFLFLALAPRCLGWQKWRVSVPLAAIVALGVFYLFNNILMVPLPEGIFAL
ncbi:tripartite tricarboxylate transporter TctB family protein [Sporolituus thermophilus]|uniref:Putative tricarboxylic transport membrane protein n=1 Tax=Sporolituus thermophilus DSM 23256 TaxID=1123285 RepID=A0A1G7L9X9_9FIRM|nr:tripartite tricarboxylate transporter TctB family protein [Sporolituus thermophilus]SDF45809.1 putative tricarboxylic transport membrane protein [Sporolituus thermophilus DSM 23256]